MKSKINRLEEEKGMAIILVVFISTILLIAFYGLSLRMLQSHKSSVKIVGSDKALYLADAGIQDALGKLRNPEFNYLLPTSSFNATALNGEGSYSVSFATTTGAPAGRQWIVAMSRGTLTQTGSCKMVRAVVEVQDLGQYSFFVTGNAVQQFNGGTTLAGEVYARRPQLSIGNPPGTSLKATAFTWVDEPADNTDNILLGYAGNESRLQKYDVNPLNPPVQLTPVKLTQAKTALTLDNVLNNSAALFTSNQTLAYGYISDADKAYFANAANIYPPSNNKGIYYYEGTGDLEIKGEVHGRITFVAKNGNIRIMGDITRGNLKDASNADLDPLIHPVTKVGLFTNKNVIIDKQNATSPNDVTINAQVFAPNGGFVAEMPPTGPTGKKVKFTGSITLKDPVSLGGVYGGGNEYTYDENVYKSDPFPYLTKVADVISWKEVTEF